MIRKSSSLQQATDDNMKLLAEAETLFFDGTFHTCPENFYQIFTVHAFKNGQQFPLAYCLLPDKTRSSYQRTFTLLNYPSCRFFLSSCNHQGMLLPLLSMSKQEDTADRPSSRLSRNINSIDLWGRQLLWHLCHWHLYDWHRKQLNLKHLNYPELRSSSHIMKRRGSWETSVYNFGMFLTAAQ